MEGKLYSCRNLLNLFGKLTIVLFILFMIASCSGGGGGGDGGDGGDGGGNNNDNSQSISGVIQKGPFKENSKITIYALDNQLNRIDGKIFKTETINDKGSFKISKEFSAEFVEIEAEGSYFNEISGNVDSDITLRTFSKISKSNKININILTTLSAKRIKKLVSEGTSFDEAVKISKDEILAAFNINEDNIDDFDKMDISVNSNSGAILLTVSSIMQGNNSSVQLSDFIDEIANDIEAYGSLNDENLKAKVCNSSMALNLTQIRQNVHNCYHEMGEDIAIPKFEDYVDSDGDGVIGKNVDGDINNSLPEFDWDDSPDSIYHFQLSSTSDFSTILEEKEDLEESNYTVKDKLSNLSSYFWRVAVDKDGQKKWGPTHKFTLDIGKVTLQPSGLGGYKISRPTFKWSNSSLGGVKYRFQLSSNGTDDSIIEDSKTLGVEISAPNYTTQFTELVELEKYYWRIAVIDKNGVQGEWSDFLEFMYDLGKVTLLSPSASGTNFSKPYFMWSYLAGLKYHFQLSSDPSFEDNNKILLNKEDISSTSYAMTSSDSPLKNATPYYWRVAVVDQFGKRGAWTETISFQVDLGTVALHSPGGSGYGTSQPTLDWSDSNIAVKYIIQFSENSDFTGAWEYETDNYSSYHLEDITLENLRTYYWRVAVVDENDIRGEWSDYKECKVDLGTVTPEAPTGDISVLRPSFSWSKSNLINIRYHFQISSDSSFYDPIEEAVVESNNYEMKNNLANATNYYWRIRVVDENNVYGSWTNPAGIIVGLGDWAAVAAGEKHTIAIKKDGTLYAWGNNEYGQLGDGTNIDKSIPTKIGNSSSWASVAVGYTSSYAVKNDGSLYAWGNNEYYQLGDGTNIDKIIPTRIGTETGWSLVSAGKEHAVALKKNGIMYTWGDDGYGQLGDTNEMWVMYRRKPTKLDVSFDDVKWSSVAAGRTYTIAITIDGRMYSWGHNSFGTTENIPTQIGTDKDWIAVSSTSTHAVALKRDGTLYTWGGGYNGQLGNGTSGQGTTINYPTKIGNDTDWVSISAGGAYTIALKKNGTYYAWGSGYYGQFGDGTSGSNLLVPTKIGYRNDWASLIAGHNHTIGITKGGTLYTWGKNDNSQLGDGTSIQKETPIRIGTDYVEPIIEKTQWISVSGGESHTVAIKANGTLYAWGYNDRGQIGTGGYGPSQYSKPSKIGSDNDWKSVHAGRDHNLAIKNDGTLYGWGYNLNGELGDASYTNKYIPIQIGTDNDWDSVTSGLYHTIGIKKDGSIYGWGKNTYGSIGDGTNEGKNIPTKIGTQTDWVSVSTGEYHSVAIKLDGTVYTWGRNNKGQLGNGTNEDSDIPVQVGLSNDWASVFAGSNHTIAIKKDGTLYAWGDNQFGQLGDGTNEENNTPVRIGSDTDWGSIISCGYSHTIVRKTDGSLYAWGRNNYGQLGNGTWNDISIPTLIDFDSNLIKIASGYYHTLAVTTDGSLYAWGDNQFGQLGNCSYIYEPIQIGSDNDWSLVSAGSNYTMAIKNDNTLYGWGFNGNGQFGDGTDIDKYVPTQIGYDNDWTLVSANDSRVFTLKSDGTIYKTENDNYIQIGTDNHWATLSTGLYHYVALKNDGSLYAWGSNSKGQYGFTMDNTIPTRIGTSDSYNNLYNMVSAGYLHTVAIKSDGTLYSWGNNELGQLGRGLSVESKTNPTQVGTDNDWAYVSAAGYFTIAIKSDGRMYSWGNNDSGQLGLGHLGCGVSPSKNYPTQIGNDSDWAYVAAGPYSVFAIKKDGRLFAWGSNGYGRLGISHTSEFSWKNKTTFPVQVGSDNDWAYVSAGSHHTIAIKKDGSIFAWGYNSYSQLGNGSHFNKNVPTEVK